MAKIIAISNQKGGVGKTTTVANMGFGLCAMEKRVLLVDFDSQASLTQVLGYQNPDELPMTIPDYMEAYISETPLDKNAGLLEISRDMHLLPSDITLANIDVSLVNAMNRESVLKGILAEFRDEYDYILIDTNPSLGMLTLNALTASDSVIIPAETQYLSAKGLERLLATISKVRKQLNPNLEIEGILFTMLRNTNHSKNVVNSVIEAYGENIRIFDSKIPYSVEAADAGMAGKSIFEYAPKGNVAESYKSFIKEVADDGEKQRANQFETDR